MITREDLMSRLQSLQSSQKGFTRQLEEARAGNGRETIIARLEASIGTRAGEMEWIRSLMKKLDGVS